jgi:hypothetical protein
MTGHLIAATAAAALVAIAAAFVLRRQRAAWRYAILLAAVFRFALPTPWLAQAGGMLVRYVPARPPAFDEIGRLLLRVEGAAPLPGRVPPRSAPLNPLPILWGAGAVLSLGVWARRLRTRIPAVRPPSSLETEAL